MNEKWLWPESISPSTVASGPASSASSAADASEDLELADCFLANAVVIGPNDSVLVEDHHDFGPVAGTGGDDLGDREDDRTEDDRAQDRTDGGDSDVDRRAGDTLSELTVVSSRSYGHITHTGQIYPASSTIACSMACAPAANESSRW